MNVLSLFDGLSGCRVALERIGVTPNNYYASEIDKYAITVAQANYPDTVQIGSVTEWQTWDIDWASIDLVTGGFPCQAWSVAGKQQGDKDERGMLFWTMLDVMKQVMSANPNAKFLIENVKMKKEFEQYITHHTEQALGEVHKTLINSALVSAQNRNRYYWTNFPVTQPEDLGIVLADIIEDGEATSEMTTKADKSYSLTASYAGAVAWNSIAKKQRSMVLCDDRPCKPREFNPESICHHAADATDIKGNESIKRVYAPTGKAPTLTTMGGGHREPKVLCTSDNPRIKGITEDERGFRPHKGDKAKSGISEIGRILKPTASKTDTVISAHAPKVLCGALRGRYKEDGNTQQNLEVRKDGKTNSLTTVQKDNVVVALMPASIVGRRLNERGCRDDYNKDVPITQCLQVKHNNEKMGCLTTVEKDTLLSDMPPGRYPNAYGDTGLSYRKLTPLECERLQTLPDNYTAHVSNSQRYKMIGNGWTIDVIAHILKHGVTIYERC